MMMNASQHLHGLSSTASTRPSSSLLPKPFVLGHGSSPACVLPTSRRTLHFHGKQKRLSIRASLLDNLKGLTTSKENATSVKAVIRTSPVLLSNIASSTIIGSLLLKPLLLELVSAEVDPATGSQKETIQGHARQVKAGTDEVTYECEFTVPAGFGEVGAILVQNELLEEIYLYDIVLNGFPNSPINFNCSSWVHSKNNNPSKRIFFSNKSYLPDNTPAGLKELRETDLESLRGNGEGERKDFERIYDYDTYNDLGNPDISEDLARPVLGSAKHPYPRRCRTGRAPTKKDPSSESRKLLDLDPYVPRDEKFADVKTATFGINTLKSVVNAFLPTLEVILLNPELGFPTFTDIDTLFKEGIPVPKDKNLLQLAIPTLVKLVTDGGDEALLFDSPEMLERDKFSWFRDEEFSRQTLAGLNPYGLELVAEWPLKSKLDPEIYGPPESLITSELVEEEIKGVMTIDEALKQKKLFILDYHDLLLPYVSKVRELEGTTLYGSRTLFFLTHVGTLRPLAIELTRPPIGDKPQWKQVFTPGCDGTAAWLWRLAKAHVTAHDSGFHQLVSHWLRTHCCTEPYIIATNRQLSAMHPINKLLRPHFRYTMEINALARQLLINAGGIIESCFSPGKYCIEISSVAYDKLWRFDKEALPADLIKRGMAVEDPTAEHGLKLTIEDYPFANDGLILWDAIKKWVTAYVNHYYPDPSLVESDKELQDWWTEVRTKGHADKKDEPWWPVLKTPEDLVNVLTTIIWVAAGHHAAVNFGQYTYAGYFPNRPTITRTNMPTEDPVEDEFKNFLKKPEFEMLKCLPSKMQATKVMAVLNVLSSHSPDEEYIGDLTEPSWEEDPVIKAAFEQFNGRLKELEGIIDERNNNLDLKNRAGAGVVPYELLKPNSETGVTGKGVPKSISI